MSIENIQIIETVSLDFYNNNIKTINVKQLDTDARGVKVNCTEHGKKFKLDPLSHSAFVRYKKPDGNDVLNDCYIQDDGSIVFPLTQQMTVVAGKSKLDILIFCKSGLKVEDIGDITNFNDLGISTLSTMILGLNISPNATNLEKVESSHEYNALINGLAAHVATEKHMEELDATLNKNEEQRKSNELERQSSEATRENAEVAREKNENTRKSNENQRIEKEISRETAESLRDDAEKAREIAEGERKVAEIERENRVQKLIDDTNTSVQTLIDDTNTTVQELIDETNSKVDEAISLSEEQTNKAEALINEIYESVNYVIRDDISSETTTYSSKKTDEIISNLSNQNLFINGNFVISYNAESFEIYGTSNEESYTEICDKWCAKHYDLENNYYITREGHGSGIRIVGIGEVQNPCYIFQILEADIFNSIVGKTVTLSWSYTQSFGDANHVEYETLTESKQIFVDYNIDLETFTTLTRIGFESGVNGCVVHWIKLEVGELQTKYVPDSKDAIICKLENQIGLNDITDIGDGTVTGAINTFKKNYIVQQGTSGIWTYRKWSDGTAECWGKKNYGTLSLTAPFGTLYESTVILSESLPSSLFIETPCINMSVIRSDGCCWIERCTNPYPSTTNVGGFWVCRPTSQSVENLTIGYHVIGKWK